MRIASLASASLLALSIATGASAADLPRKSVAPVFAQAPALSWTGFYVGVHAGAIFGGDKGITRSYSGAAAAAAVAAPFSSPFVQSFGNGTGFLGGIQAGYNYQINQFVVGLEADISATSRKQSVTLLGNVAGPGFGSVTTRDTTWLGTVRGRLGFLVTQQLMLYGTGGFAFGSVKFTDTAGWSALIGVPAGTASNSSTKTGWTLGGGLEYAITNNWSLKGEYLYYSLGKSSTFILGPAAFPTNIAAETKNNGHVARIGINYQF